MRLEVDLSTQSSIPPPGLLLFQCGGFRTVSRDALTDRRGGDQSQLSLVHMNKPTSQGCVFQR